MAWKIDEEEILPSPAPARARLDANQVDTTVGKRTEGRLECTRLVLQREHDTRHLFFGARGVSREPNDEEPRRVIAAILDTAGEDRDTAGFGRGGGSDGGGTLGLAGHLFDGGGGAVGLDQGRVRRMSGEPTAALGEGDILGQDTRHCVEGAEAHEALLDGQRYLSDDLEFGFRQEVKGVAHDALGGVLHWHDAVGSLARFDGGEDIANRTQRQGWHAGAKGPQLGLLREGTFGSEVGDGLRHLGADGKGDHFAEDRTDAGRWNIRRRVDEGAQDLLFALGGVHGGT